MHRGRFSFANKLVSFPPNRSVEVMNLRQFWSFRAKHQPYMVRHSYVHELRSATTYPLAAALAEGAFTSVVAAKFFNAPPILIAVISAAPMFGNIAALFWSQISERYQKVRFVNCLQLGVILSIAAVSLTWFLPKSQGAWVFAGLIICARVLASGIVTVRSAIWRYNYPRHVRGQIIARISAVATACLAAATYLGAKWLDASHGTAYVYLYPAAAMLGAIGIWQFSRIRVRHEWQLRRRGRDTLARPENIAQTEEANVLNYRPARKKGSFWRDARQVLREDARFREYMRWQFISGGAFMMMGPALFLMVSREMTDPVKEYGLATLVVQVIPMVTSIIFTQVWAPFFDRVSILVFRSSQGAVTLVAMSTMCIGAIADQLWLIALAQFFVGITNAAGNLAWNLGHNDFTTAEKAPTYMAVNVMLTGTRGAFAPFLGIWLYESIVGRYVFLVCAICSFVGQYGFYCMARREQREKAAQATRQPAKAGVGATSNS